MTCHAESHINMSVETQADILRIILVTIVKIIHQQTTITASDKCTAHTQTDRVTRNSRIVHRRQFGLIHIDTNA